MKGDILKPVKRLERAVTYGAMCRINSQDAANILDGAMQVLFSKLDDTIDDVKNGRVIYKDELWEELDAI